MHIAFGTTQSRRVVLLTVLCACPLLSPACSKSPTQPQSGPHDSVVFPIKQYWPSWLVSGRLAYIDAGITCVKPNGGYEVDPARHGVYLFDPITQRRTRIAAADYGVACHPSREILAYSDGQSITICDTSGAVLQRKVVSAPAVHLAWSPDGTLLAWQQVDVDPGIWCLDVSSMIAHKVRFDYGGPSWLAGSNTLVGGAPNATRNAMYLVAMSLDGSRVDTLCTVPLRVYALGVVESPGELIVIARGTGDAESHIYRVDIATGKATQLGPVGASDPALNLATGQIAFVREAARSISPEDNVIWLWSGSSQPAAVLIPAWPGECQ